MIIATTLLWPSMTRFSRSIPSSDYICPSAYLQVGRLGLKADNSRRDIIGFFSKTQHRLSNCFKIITDLNKNVCQFLKLLWTKSIVWLSFYCIEQVVLGIPIFSASRDLFSFHLVITVLTRFKSSIGKKLDFQEPNISNKLPEF